MLGEIAASVLADSAFLMLEAATGDVDWPPAVLIAEIPFEGVAAGRLVLAACEAMITAATADMLRLDPADPLAREAAPATLAELSNVLLGVLAERYAEKDRPCVVGLPTTRRGTWPRTDAGVRCSTVLLDASRRPVAVALTTPAVRLT
jgi:hypothetical protein